MLDGSDGLPASEKGKSVAAKSEKPTTDSAVAASGRLGPDLLHAIFIDGELTNPIPFDDLDLHVAEGDSQAASGTRNASAALLDLALGCQRLRQEGPPPFFLSDNLQELRAEYEATLSDYRSKRTHAVNALIMLSFFGGLGLALLVTMLGLLRIVWGSRLWLPTLVATACCVVVTSVSNEPSRMKSVEAAAVGFAPYLPSPDDPRGAKDFKAATAEPAADSRLRSLAEKLSKAEGDIDALKADRFAMVHYIESDISNTASGGDTGTPLAWYPLLTTGADGRVTLTGLAPPAGKPRRLLIDAWGDGRIESCELAVK